MIRWNRLRNYCNGTMGVCFLRCVNNYVSIYTTSRRSFEQANTILLSSNYCQHAQEYFMLLKSQPLKHQEHHYSFLKHTDTSAKSISVLVRLTFGLDVLAYELAI